MYSVTLITVTYVFKSEIFYVIVIHRPAGGISKNVPHHTLVRLRIPGLQSLVTCPV
jgi:hypothetical protein